MDSYKTQVANMIIHELHKSPQISNGFYPETYSESSYSEFSAAPPFQNAYIATPSYSNSSPFLQNVEIPNDFPCTSLSMVPKTDATEAMRETIFRVAMMQPIQIDSESLRPPERKNVRISKDPQSVAARRRRERISQRIRILQRMVPGGTKLDTASMLDEAVHYLKFLKKQVQSLEQAAAGTDRPVIGAGFFPVGLG